MAKTRESAARQAETTPNRAAILHVAFLLTGIVRMIVTELEQLAGDLLDDDVSVRLARVRSSVERLGDEIVRQKHA